MGNERKKGPLAYGKKEEQVFLGKDYGSRQADYSESTAVEIDQEVRRIVQEQYKRVRLALEENKGKLETLANMLIERETLDSEEIHAALEGREIAKRERVIIQSYADKDKAAKEKRKVASIFAVRRSLWRADFSSLNRKRAPRRKHHPQRAFFHSPRALEHAGNVVRCLAVRRRSRVRAVACAGRSGRKTGRGRSSRSHRSSIRISPRRRR